MNSVASETRLTATPTSTGLPRRLSLAEIETALRYWRRRMGRSTRGVGQCGVHAQALARLYANVLESRDGLVLSDHLSLAEYAALHAAKLAIDRDGREPA
jgi:hypothetical protein